MNRKDINRKGTCLMYYMALCAHKKGKYKFFPQPQVHKMRVYLRRYGKESDIEEYKAWVYKNNLGKEDRTGFISIEKLLDSEV